MNKQQIKLRTGESVEMNGKLSSYPLGTVLTVGKDVTPDRARWLVLAGRAVAVDDGAASTSDAGTGKKRTDNSAKSDSQEA